MAEMKVLNLPKDQSWTGYVLGKHGNIPRARPASQEHEDIARLVVHINGAMGLPNIERTGTSDPYVVMTMGPFKQRTSTKCNNLNPNWNEHMTFPVYLAEGWEMIRVNVEVYDENYTNNVLMCSGTLDIPFDRLDRRNRSQAVNLSDKTGEDGGLLRCTVELKSMNGVERNLEDLSLLTYIPLLPRFAKIAHNCHDEVIESWDFLAAKVTHPISTSCEIVFELWKAPITVATTVTKGAVRKILKWMV
eukprot:gnl/TRDRNA2_/TRDRNA2_190729_c0_seq1.p1 gnl/TRDRNA2_/TRDRNA2_190729_c0~~gnl/TRDRNA2_/TRDRNA2_190729_c0_seq1.p1  ORF type:complete len:247 (+),score=42.87 gnl/TRDRNA2_/TRDRNA2_190729_c0_seq1:70-810(+)